MTERPSWAAREGDVSLRQTCPLKVHGTLVLSAVLGASALVGVGNGDAAAARASGYRVDVRSTSAPAAIVFNLDNQLWTERSNGTHRAPLVQDGDLDQQPAWAPNGHRIAFVRELGTAALQLVVLDTTTGTARTVTNSREDSIQPAWSPNGKTLAFVRDDTVCTLNLRTGHVRRLWRGVNPAWSPDEHRIAFVTYSNRGGRLFTGNPATRSTPRPLTSVGVNVGTPAYSPNGDLLAYTRFIKLPPHNLRNDATSLEVRNLHTGHVHRVATTKHGVDAWPTFGPGSSGLIFARTNCERMDGGCVDDLERITVTSAGLRTGTMTGLGQGGSPAWKS